jgi:transcription antitermination protein NusB
VRLYDKTRFTMNTNRRKARELTLQVLYACESGNDEAFEQVLGTFGEEVAGNGLIAGYAKNLVKKVLDSKEKIDELLSKHTAHWDLKRMTVIDRNILRMAVGELLFFTETPYKVVIDEAVEIAKIYGTEESWKFVNGVIDSIHKEMNPNSESRE